MRPTNIRWLIVGVAMLAAVLLYLERVCLSVADVYIREDLRIGKMEMDLAFGAFFIAYALGQVPSGWLSQRYGPRLMLTLYMLGWSVFGVFIALAQDVYTLVAARFLLGLSQAGAYPTAALLVKRWVPDRNRGLASSIVAFGGRFGGAGATGLTGLFIIAFVPMTTAATFTADQILDPAQFWNEFAKRYELPEEKDPLRPVIRAVEFERGPVNPMTLDTRLRQPAEIAELLNRVIRQPGRFDKLDWDRVALPSDGKSILAKPAAERTSQESERFNRLVVEKAFPGAVRQLHVEGWRPTLLIYGLAGIVVGGLFWAIARNWPRDHPWANRAEVDLIETGQSKAAQEAGTDSIPWAALAASRNQWIFSATNFFSNIGWVFLITLMPRFLDERFQVPVDERSRMAMVPLLVGMVGLLAGGWFTDYLTRTRGRRWGRAIPMGLFKFPCAVAMLVSVYIPDAWTVVLLLAFMSVCQDFGVPAVWAFAQDTGGKQVGAVIGWGNMWGNFGAGLAPPLLGLIGARLGWDTALVVGAIAFVLCGITGLMCNAAEPLFPERREES